LLKIDMTPFTTSKGEFIAVPVTINEYGGYALQDWPDCETEIIGLSSDILKDEELAKKVVQGMPHFCDFGMTRPSYRSNRFIELFQSLLDLHKIEGNQLIIKKK